MNNRLREARRNMRWNVTQAAAEIGITEQHLRRIEKGTVNPHPLTRAAISKAYGEEEHFLFPGEER